MNKSLVIFLVFCIILFGIIIGLLITYVEYLNTKVTMPYEPHSKLFIITPSKYVDPIMESILMETNMSEKLIFRLLFSESSMIPNVIHSINKDGSQDKGWCGANNAFIPYYAITFMNGDFNPEYFTHSFIFSARYISFLYSQTKDMKKAVLAYKMGLKKITKAGPNIKRLAYTIVYG